MSDLLFPLNPSNDSKFSYAHTTSTQNAVLDIMHPDSIYNSLLLSLQVGQGKTYVAAALAHTYMYSGYYVLYLSHTLTAIENFRREYDTFVLDHRIDKVYKDSIDCMTFSKIHNMITSGDNERYKSKINKKYGLVVIDEVHNLREGKFRFDSIRSMLSKWNNYKLLLITATPMIDNARELDTLRSFIPFASHDNEHYNYKNNNKTRNTKGYVCANEKCKIYTMYSGKSSCTAIKNYVGISLSNGYKNKSINETLNISVIRGKQRDEYLEASKKYTNSIDNKLRQLSIASEDYESSKVDNIISNVKEGELTAVFSFFKKKGVYAVAKGLEKTGLFKQCTHELVNKSSNSPNVDTFISKFPQFSTVAAEPDYLSFSDGSEEDSDFDYEEELKLMKSININNEGNMRRYAIVTGSTPKEEINNILTRFTSIYNKTGKDIEILLGTNVIAEAISLRELRHLHILHPFWNYGTVHQIIGRATRMHSYINIGTVLNIYLHASVVPTDEENKLTDSQIIELLIQNKFEGMSSDIETWAHAGVKENGINKALANLTITSYEDDSTQSSNNESPLSSRRDSNVSVKLPKEQSNIEYKLPEVDNILVFKDELMNSIFDLRECVDYTASKISWARFMPEHSKEYSLYDGSIKYASLPRMLKVYKPPVGYSAWRAAGDGRIRITYIDNTNNKRNSRRGKLTCNMTHIEMSIIAKALDTKPNIADIIDKLKEQNRYFENQVYIEEINN